MPIIGDYDPAEDRIELIWRGTEDAPVPLVEIEHADDGSALIRMDGEAMARVLNGAGLRAEDILLRRVPALG
ncbi:hypothetical protein RGQ15_04035 [Paracoccus sp. MBLB3053]|uniref:DUF2283 domain-containing protein n=1 Tax=Paracoccus aurantius TaxID=3073814 RepID=A0ABU2HNY6_9RHOB|nr:hypothetical protein [Paracoccus sp. MBLB3053]MDS9466752.1 hypothetical protein [Paracoccus sp. MBLB3053]